MQTSKQKTIHQVFEHQVQNNPTQIALIIGDQRLSYQQLNARANRLAHYLVSLGTQPGDSIALSLPRCPDMVIAILAILKAGAAYLPLEASSPDSRTLFFLNEAKVELIISDQHCESLLEGHRSVISASAAPTMANEFNLDLAIGDNDKCYTMYTSGSTGTPKGVMVPHRAVIRLVDKPNYVTINPCDNIFQFAPLSFDASTFEIWGALLNGATLVLYSGDGLDPNLFARELKDNQVTILWLTAALFHLIVTRYIEALDSVKTLLAGGDVLYPKVINKLLDANPAITIVNGYGPTENTTFTCAHQMTTNNRPSLCVPIGKAITGTEIYVLDEQRQAVEPGQKGELYTSGDGVALGYSGHSYKSDSGNNSPVEDSFFYNANIAPGLIYRTGDLVKQNHLGEIEFVGRKDNQIKVRGFRVSIEEIQSNLLKLEQVNQAVVILNKFDGGDQQLVSYLQLQPGHQLKAADIKKSLATKLPRYMVPDLIHLDKELPINKNGKVDKENVLETLNQ
jgi:amino acid adenylation domain-containing protein